MTEQQLRLLLSLEPEDFKWHELWDDDWEWLMAENLIEFEGKTEIPTLTELGRKVINKAVEVAIAEVLRNQ